ncbi:MAG: hypothetical protein U0T82_17370 [Bacteroidales bacterium]
MDPVRQPIIDTIVIVFEDQKDILKALWLLPDSAIGSSWEWSLSERKHFVDSALKYGYFINKDEFFYKKFKSPTHFKSAVVDGFWEMKMYSVSPESKLLLTHFVTGDGDDLCCYKLAKDGLVPVNDFFPRNYSLWLFNPATRDSCKVIPDDEYELGLDYKISDDSILVYNHYAKYDSICFNGNTLYLLFNKSYGRMEYHSVEWRSV